MKATIFAAVSGVAFCSAGQLSAQSGHAMHGVPERTERRPFDPGQGAFGAVSEIIGMLNADPATDWSTVDIDALRKHLVGMELTMTEAKVSSSNVEGGAVFTISTGDPAGIAAARMARAHGPVLATKRAGCRESKFKKT